MTPNERVNIILEEKRMSKGTLDNPGNRLQGLFDLINTINRADMNIVELGSYEGASSELFLLTLFHDPNNKIYGPNLTCIDPWDTGDNFEQESKDDLIRAEKIFDERMKPYIGMFTKLKMKANDAVSQIGIQSVDLVYIDDDHRPEALTQNVKLWLPKIKSIGYIAGHDWGGGVKEVIERILGNPLTVFQDGSWYFRKSDIGGTDYDPVKVYDEIYANDPSYGSENPDRNEYIDDFVKRTPGKLLDAGCGQGQNVRRYASRNITGIEFSKACFDKYLKEPPFINTDIISYSKVCPIRYDGIICTDVLEHIPESHINDTLIALKKLGQSILFGIANHSDIKRGHELHLIQKSMPWWEMKLKEFWIDVKFIDVHNTILYIFEVK